jgi:hypothetical protein
MQASKGGRNSGRTRNAIASKALVPPRPAKPLGAGGGARRLGMVRIAITQAAYDAFAFPLCSTVCLRRVIGFTLGLHCGMRSLA